MSPTSQWRSLDCVECDVLRFNQQLLIAALRTLTQRFARVAGEAGYGESFIENCVRYELALCNRLQLSEEAKCRH